MNMQSTQVIEATIKSAVRAAREMNRELIVVEEDRRDGRAVSVFRAAYADTDPFEAFNTRILATIYPDGEVERY